MKAEGVNNSLFSFYLKVALARQRLIEMAESYGRGDPRVVAFSQKIDKWIVELQKRRLVK